TSYDRSGALITLQYPSSRTVTDTYNVAGQTTSVSGYLGDGASRTYSTGITYTALGGMTQEQFGTDTAVYNKLFYNSPGQLSEIRESTTPNDTSWNRGAIVNYYSGNCWGMCGGNNSTTAMTDNNGNVKKQEFEIPDNESVSSAQAFLQTYSYDNLNRLTSVN